MIIDTDVLIWAQRGNVKAIKLIEKTEILEVSVLTYMELLQNANKKLQHQIIKDFLSEFNVTLLPLNEAIGHRALIYIEQYSLSHGIRAGDAIIAATTVERNSELVSANIKHYKMIQDLNLVTFKP